jgi:hypothetical protein
MSQYVESPCRAFTAGAARDRFLRVKLSGTSLATAGASDVSIGTQETESFAATDIVPVRLTTAQGTRKMVASGEITAGNPVYAAADGKIAGSGTVVEGRALESAAADDDVIEVLGIPNTDISATITGTNAAAFEVDADAATPKIALQGQAAGTGDFTTTLKPETTLSADNAIIVPEADGDTLAAVALAQTLTNKTLTAPVIQVISMAGTSGNQEIRLTTNLADALSIEDTAGDLVVFTTTTDAQAIAITPVLVLANGVKATAQEVTPDDSESALNTITAGVTAVDVQAVTNDANDFIVLPSLADVPVGHEITILCNAGTNFELRTPAESAEEINSEDCDGTKEYLCTDTEVLKVVKISDTIGWMAHAYSAIGAVVTAVIPD